MKKAVLIKIAIAVVVIIAVALCLYFIPIQNDVNYTFDAYLIYNEKRSQGEECTVCVEGKFRDYLFKEDEFEGIFSVDDVMMYSKPIKVVFSSDMGITQYVGRGTDMYIERNLSNGAVFLDRECSRVMISSCFDLQSRIESADEMYRCIIVAPAKDKREASSIADWFKQRGAFDGQFSWINKIYG